MLKKYLGLAGSFILIDLILVFFNWKGFLPLENLSSFALIAGVLILLAFYFPREFFWFFLTVLPLENVFLLSENFPISLKLYQLCAVVLFLGLILRRITKQEKIFLANFFWHKENRKVSFNWLNWGVLSWLGFFSLGGILNGFSRTENWKWFLILGSFIFIFFLAQKFFQTFQEKAEGLYFFLNGWIVVWLVGFYQALAQKLNWQAFVVMDGRINGTFLEPDWLGIYIAFCLGLLLGLKIFLTNWKNGKKLFWGQTELPKIYNRFLNIKICFLGGLLALTVSRSAWVASLIIVFVYGFLLIRLSKKNFWQSIKEIGLVIVLLGLSFGIVSLTRLSNFDFLNRAASTINGEQKITVSCQKNIPLPEKINNLDELDKLECRHINLEEIEREKQAGFFIKEVNRPDPNVNIRKNIYFTIIQEIKRHPWLGQGWGASSRILGQDEKGNGLNASNIFLEIWLATGMVGLFSFLVVLLLAGKIVLSLPKEIQSFFWLSGIAFFLANLFNAGIFSGFFWVWLASINFNKNND